MTATAREIKDDDRSPFLVARLTPRGRGGIACVGALGVRALETLIERWTFPGGADPSSVFASPSRAATTRPYFGRFRLGAAEDAPSDEVVLRLRTPTAFEVACHGGDLIAARIVETFVGRGARVATGVEWERSAQRLEAVAFPSLAPSPHRAFARNNRVDALFYAAADDLVARATAEEPAKIAVGQRAAWRRVFAAFADDFESLARHPDATALRARVFARFEALASTRALGRLLESPIFALFVGAPNVGKSSLLNALLGSYRATVSPVAGTTRDLVGAELALGGWNFKLVDAAGVRDSTDPIERLGVLKVAEASKTADLILRVLDASCAESCSLASLGVETHGGALGSLTTANKVDLTDASSRAEWRVRGAIPTSARTGEGVEELADALLSRVGEYSRSRLASSAGAVVWTESQAQFLGDLRDATSRGEIEGCVEALNGC